MSIAIEFERVTFSHGNLEVLRDASFHVHSGEFVALIGPNGAGKSTIIRLIMGLASPSSGAIRVFGSSPEQSRGKVGYVPQYMNFDPAFPISVEEVVRMGGLQPSGRRWKTLRGITGGRGFREAGTNPDILKAMELAGVADLAGRSYTALSGGQRRRVLVARALASAPGILILDEPTANMDRRSEERLFEVLGNLRKDTTILIATHDTAFVSSLTDVVLCVGEREEHALGVVRHASGPTEHISSGIYGGDVKKVLHDTEEPDTCCNCGPGQAAVAVSAARSATTDAAVTAPDAANKHETPLRKGVRT